MPQIPGLPDHMKAWDGVQMNEPPGELIESTMGVIGKAVAQLKDGEKGKLVWVATKNGDKLAVNAAVVNKFNDHFEVTLWIGKTWGQPISAGVAGAVTW